MSTQPKLASASDFDFYNSESDIHPLPSHCPTDPGGTTEKYACIPASGMHGIAYTPSIHVHSTNSYSNLDASYVQQAR
jgi:hypothetical protein